MTGSSHGGIVQNMAALYRPPHLTALWVDVAPTSAFAWMSRQGGAMALHMYGALYLHGFDAPEIQDDPVALRRIEEGVENLRDELRKLPFKPGAHPDRGDPQPREGALPLLPRGRVHRVLEPGVRRPAATLRPFRRRSGRLLERLVRPLPHRGGGAVRRPRGPQPLAAAPPPRALEPRGHALRGLHQYQRGGLRTHREVG